jgi:hypothetical protein
VPLLEPQDFNAGVDSDSINLGKIHQALILISFGELTGNAVLTVYTGATAGTKTTAETFRYRRSSAELKTASGDLYDAWATSAALTLTAATYEDFLLMVQVNSDEFTAAQPWLTLEFGSEASELFASAVAVCVPRFVGNTVIA